MNILQVVPELNAGGVERTTIEIAQALTAAGHQTHIVSAGGRLEDELRAAGGILHVLRIGSKNPLTLRHNTKALIRIIKDHNIDAVHARSRAPAWAAKTAATATNIPFITTYHGIYNAKSRLKRRYNAIMTKGDIIIANSEYTKAHIMTEHGVAADKITVIARGVDVSVFDPAKTPKPAVTKMKASWGVDPKLPLVLLPGRLTRWKGQLVAAKALSLCNVKAQLVLLGDAQGRTDYVEEIETLADQLGLAKRVIIAPHTPDMPTAYRAADLVIAPSTDPEAFGRVAIEAQAMGLMVVASNHGGATETVMDGKTGKLVTPGNADELAAAIDQFLGRSLSTKTQKGKKARARIAKLYSTKSLQSATLAVYKNILARNKS